MSANGFKDQESVKPDWFSLVESDTRVQKNTRDRGFRVVALAGPLLLISAGLLFAQTNEGQNAAATEDTSIAAPVTSGTTELATSTPTDVGIATDPQATGGEEATSFNSGNSAVGVTAQSTPSHSRESINASSGTTVSPTTKSGSTTSSSSVGTPVTTPGFVPPAAGVSTASSSDDDDAFEGDRGHGDDDDAYEHEDSDEGDDD